jgi:hypothetical protein
VWTSTLHADPHSTLGDALAGTCTTPLKTAGPGVDVYSCGAFTELAPGGTCQVRCQNGHTSVSGAATSEFVCDYGPLVQSTTTPPLRCARLCSNVTCSAYHYTAGGVELPYQTRGGLTGQETCQSTNGAEDCITPCCAPRMLP